MAFATDLVLSSALVIATAVELSSQSIATIGTSCRTRGTVLEAYGAAVPGQTLKFHVRDAAPNAAHLLLLGFSSTSWNGNPLPWSAPVALGFAPGCALLVSADAASGVLVEVDGRGELPVPLQASLVAATLYIQALGLPTAEPWYGTNAVAVSIAAAPLATVVGQVAGLGTGQPTADALVLPCSRPR